MTVDAIPIAAHNCSKARPALMRVAGLVACALLLNGCGSVGAGVGFSVPVLPGVSIGVGFGSGGPSVGVTAGSGPWVWALASTSKARSPAVLAWVWGPRLATAA